jgi:hypothetical protein
MISTQALFLEVAPRHEPILERASRYVVRSRPARVNTRWKRESKGDGGRKGQRRALQHIAP